VPRLRSFNTGSSRNLRYPDRRAASSQDADLPTPPPVGFGTWDDYWRDVGVPDVDLGIGADRIIEASESKTVKNRLHLDIHASGGQAVPIATRRERVDAEARRLTDLGATTIGVLDEQGIDHYAVAIKDPEGNEFDIN
jgi:hypothetical protein